MRPSLIPATVPVPPKRTSVQSEANNDEQQEDSTDSESNASFNSEHKQADKTQLLSTMGVQYVEQLDVRLEPLLIEFLLFTRTCA